MTSILKLVSVCLFITSCSKSDGQIEPIPQKTFKQEQLQAAGNYSDQKLGSGILVMQNGQIIYENYTNGADTNTATHLHSATKGYSAALIAMAIQEGLISGYDENVSNTITEWKNTTLHPNKNLITIRHLVSLTSGLSQDVAYIQGDNPLAPDIYDYCVNNLKLNYTPGATFQYGPSHYYVFGVFLQRKLQQKGINQNPLQYLESKIFQKIGLTYSSWIYDVAGNPHIPNGCYITPRNWVKFGQLLLQKGKWNGQQIIDENLVSDLFIPKSTNTGHGTFLWLNKKDGDARTAGQPLAPTGSIGGFIYYKGYTDIIGLLGAGKNRMYIIPSLNAVIIRQTLEDDDTFLDNDFLELILPQ